jgi:hypothetical protein
MVFETSSPPKKKSHEGRTFWSGLPSWLDYDRDVLKNEADFMPT